MPDNILKAKIVVDAQGVAQTFNGVASSVKKADDAMKRVAPGATQATQAMTNLGRVVQDAPFGFIGVSNNINPLLESFQRLKASTGTTGGALKALGSSLLGAGGLGLAVSLVTSGILLFGNAMGGASGKAKKLSADLQALSDSGKEVSKLQALVTVARDVTASTVARTNAIEELKKSYPDYLRNLSLETINSEAAKKAIDELTASVVAKALADVYADKVAEQTLKVNEKQRDVNKLLAKQNDDLATLERIRYTEPANAVKKYSGIVEQNGKILAKQQQELEKEKDILSQLTGELNSATVASLNFVKTPKPKSIKSTVFEFDTLKAIFDKLVLTQAVFARGLEKLSSKRYNIFRNIGLDTLATNFEKAAPTISSDLQKIVDRQMKNNPILIRANNIKLDAEAAAKNLQQQIDQISKTIQAAFAGAISGFAEGIAAALAGGDIKNAFGGFVSTVGASIQAIGEQLIQLAVAALAVKKALATLFKNPLIMIAAGVALVAIGSAIKNSISRGVAGARASGGGVVAGNAYVVGERGQEVFVPNTGGRIIPNNALGNFGNMPGGMRVIVGGEFVLQGNRLVAAIAQTNQSQRRLG